MSRTLTALFDQRADAENAKQQLVQAGIDSGDIDITHQGGSDRYGTGTGTTGATGTGEHEGFWASLKNLFVPDEDRNAYAEGIRRGGYLLTADVDDHEADTAVRILDTAGSVDFDTRQGEWRSSGWAGGSTAGADYTARQTGALGATAAGGQTVSEEAIPVVQEELRIGKREVERGGARVRSYIREVPVNEQVTLRDEHVSVERRAVDQPLRAGDLSDDLLRERTIDVRETAEEAVIGKEARVVEEVVVRKTADTRVENVSDTVRRTEVEVDEGGRGFDTDRTGTGAAGTGRAGMGSANTTTGSPYASDDDLRSGSGSRVATGLNSGSTGGGALTDDDRLSDDNTTGGKRY